MWPGWCPPSGQLDPQQGVHAHQRIGVLRKWQMEGGREGRMCHRASWMWLSLCLLSLVSLSAVTHKKKGKDVLHPLWCQRLSLIDCWWQPLCVWDYTLLQVVWMKAEHNMLMCCAEISKIPSVREKSFFPLLVIAASHCLWLRKVSQPLTMLGPKDTRRNLLHQLTKKGVDTWMLCLQLVSFGSSSCCPISELVESKMRGTS